MRKLYKFSKYFGRSGDLEGIFVEDEDLVKKAMGHNVYFGEVLGKHSEVYFDLSEKDLQVLTEDQTFIFQFEKLGCASGHNPFDHIEFDEEDEEEDEEDEDEE